MPVRTTPVRRTLACAGLLVAVGAAVPAHAAPARAQADTTPPRLHLPENASFVRGSTIGPMAPDPAGRPRDTDDIAVRVAWTATDPAGVCGSSTRARYAGFAPDRWSPWSSATSVTALATDYDSQLGGGSFKVVGLDVRVRDCAGNVAEDFVGVRPAVFQEDGTSFGFRGVSAATSGAWTTTRCACWSDGEALWTETPGAQVRFTTRSAGARPVAVVMERAPDRGRARVLVDGVLQATVDTAGDPKAHRSVVWTGHVPAGRHVVTVEAVGTPGRPRIDVDAFLVSGLVA